MAYKIRLKELRLQRGLTQAEVAEALGMHVTQYRRYESGERELKLDVIILLMEFYRVRFDDLVMFAPFGVFDD